MSQFSFGDRFSYNNATFAALELAIVDATDEQLINASPELNNMAQMVRRFSILLKSTTVKDIYYAVTDHADPEIGLIISSSKNDDQSWRYPTIEDVKKFMYSPDSGDLVQEDRNKFADGIRRISAAYAAAELISRFATLSEQLSHAEALKDRATEELKMILEVAANAPAAAAKTTQEEDVPSTGRLYFEQTSHDFASPLYVYVYFPGETIDLTPVTYPAGKVSTAEIIHDISEKINEASLAANGTNILASPVLSGPRSSHFIELSPRQAVADRTADLVTIQFRYDSTDDYDSSQLPFKWGIDVDNMTTYPLNSVLLLVKASYFVASKVGEAATEDEQAFLPTVLYIKKDPVISPPPTSSYELRFPVTSPDTITTTFNRVTGVEQATLDSERYQQFALSLVNAINAVKDDTLMISAIIRNDPVSASEPVAVVELFAWSITNPQLVLTLDILDLPDDILISLGDYNGPYSRFSNRPRSIRVQSTYKAAAQAIINQSDQTLELTGTPKMVGFARSKLLDEVNDATKQFERMHDPFYYY